MFCGYKAREVYSWNDKLDVGGAKFQAYGIYLFFDQCAVGGVHSQFEECCYSGQAKRRMA